LESCTIGPFATCMGAHIHMYLPYEQDNFSGEEFGILHNGHLLSVCMHAYKNTERGNRHMTEPRLKETILIANNKDKTFKMDASRMTGCQEVLEAP